MTCGLNKEEYTWGKQKSDNKYEKDTGSIDVVYDKQHYTRTKALRHLFFLLPHGIQLSPKLDTNTRKGFTGI